MCTAQVEGTRRSSFGWLPGSPAIALVDFEFTTGKFKVITYEMPMSEGTAATFLPDVMKKVHATNRTEPIYYTHGLCAGAQKRPGPWPVALTQTGGQMEAVAE